ncbi:DNA polymerase I, partial [Candidatus Azambacteria bacterium]|nr:DNA polymerase I [Candidatus Azambacteria bacterium]
DAHALIHRSYHALPPLTSPKGEVVNAVYGFTSVLLKMLRELSPAYVVAAFDVAGPTFRHEAFERYKATRKEVPKDLEAQFPKVKEILKAFHIPVIEAPGFEADDVIGTLVEKLEKAHPELEIIITTGDLDTLQLVSAKTKVYTLKRGLQDTAIYDTKAIQERFGLEPKQLIDFKGLKGDPSDNIPGVLGIGEKTAGELLKVFGSLENLYGALEQGKAKLPTKLQEKLGAQKEQAFFSRELATIRRDAPVSLTLCDARWGAFDRKAAEAVFRTYGFQSLLSRLAEILGKEQAVPAEAGPEAPSEPLRLADFAAGMFHDAKPWFKEAMAKDEPPPNIHFDTMIAAWVIDAGLREYGFQNVYEREFHRSPRGKEALRELTARLSERLKKEKLEKVFYDIELPLIPVLARMEYVGVTLDGERLKILSRELKKEIRKREERIWKLAGEEFNVSSPQQLSRILFEKLDLQPSKSSDGKLERMKKTPGGARSTQAGELFKLKDAHPIIPLILEYREFTKLVTTYVDTLPELVRKDGRIHTTYNQTGTITGRLSSANPNLQNIPVRSSLGTEIRKAFRPEQRRVFVSFDYSQIELRIAASLSGDKTMQEAFRRGEDIHTRTAAEVFRVPARRVTPAMRRTAKVLNFGMIYGMGPQGFAEAAGVSREEAKAFIEAYFREFSGIKRYVEEAKRFGHAFGYQETLTGRRRPLPELFTQHPQLIAQGERMAINMPIQGLASDFIKLAMIEVAKWIEKRFGPVRRERRAAEMILQVHDELVLEVERDILGEVTREVSRRMEEVFSLEGVTLQVDIRAGKSWGELKVKSEK